MANDLYGENNKKATSLVRKWQQEQTEELAEEVYNIYEEYFKIQIKKYAWLEDVTGVVYETFMKCMNDFDSTNTSFSAYLLMQMQFKIKNQINYMKSPKYGANKVDAKYTKKDGTKGKTVDRSGNTWIPLDGYEKEKKKIAEVVADDVNNYDDVLTTMIWEEAKKRIKRPVAIEIIELMLQGYSQNEIVEIVNLSQPRVSSIIKQDLKKKNPEFYYWLYDALKG